MFHGGIIFLNMTDMITLKDIFLYVSYHNDLFQLISFLRSETAVIQLRDTSTPPQSHSCTFAAVSKAIKACMILFCLHCLS